MPLVNAPLLEYQLSYLKSAGVSEVCFATNYMAEAVENTFGDGSAFGLNLTYAVETEPLDTAGAIRNAYDRIPGEPCIVFNGDTIHAFNIAAFVKDHLDRMADISLALKKVERPHAYGVVSLTNEGRVSGFVEPSEEEKRSVSSKKTGEFDAINAGLYAMSVEALEAIPQRRCNIEREIFPRLIAEGMKVYGKLMDDFWVDIGRPSQYLQAVRAVVSELVQSPRKILKRGDSAVHPSAEVADSVVVCCNSSIGEGVRIEGSAKVCGSALLEGCQIGHGSEIVNSVLSEGCRIGANAQVRDAVLGAGCAVEDGRVVVGLK
jgi:mannose-1-phosphate guanylyltransferase